MSAEGIVVFSRLLSGSVLRVVDVDAEVARCGAWGRRARAGPLRPLPIVPVPPGGEERARGQVGSAPLPSSFPVDRSSPSSSG